MESIPYEVVELILEFVPEYGFRVNRELHKRAITKRHSILIDGRRYMALTCKPDTPLPPCLRFPCHVMITMRPHLDHINNLNDFEPWTVAVKCLHKLRPETIVYYYLIGKIDCFMMSIVTTRGMSYAIKESESIQKSRSEYKSIAEDLYISVIAAEMNLISEEAVKEAFMKQFLKFKSELSAVSYLYLDFRHMQTFRKWLIKSSNIANADICLGVFNLTNSDLHWWYKSCNDKIYEYMKKDFNMSKLGWCELMTAPQLIEKWAMDVNHTKEEFVASMSALSKRLMNRR